MPYFRFCFRLIFHVLVLTVKWLVQSILYISKREIFRAQRHETVQHEDQEDRYPVPCTEPNNLVYMHGLLAEEYPVPCREPNNLIDMHGLWAGRKFPVQCTEHD